MIKDFNFKSVNFKTFNFGNFEKQIIPYYPRASELLFSLGAIVVYQYSNNFLILLLPLMIEACSPVKSNRFYWEHHLNSFLTRLLFLIILSDFDPNTIFQAFFGGGPGGFGGFNFGGPGGMWFCDNVTLPEMSRNVCHVFVRAFCRVDGNLHCAYSRVSPRCLAW